MNGAQLYLVRHGEAKGADDDNPVLSQRGRFQARALAERLASIGAAEILHSPRRRATQTAAILAGAQPGVPMHASSLLDDRTPVPSKTCRADYPEDLWSWFADVPQNEQDIDGRALTGAARELKAATLAAIERGPVVAVTHAFVIGWLVRAALAAPTSAWTSLTPAHASLTILGHGPSSSHLVAFNDTGHLA